jgi:hypothetical protein
MWLSKVKGFIDDVHLDKVRLAAFRVLGPGADVSVSELHCPEPGCPPTKTVILVFRDGQPTRALTIHKSASRVGARDIERAARQVL